MKLYNKILVATDLTKQSKKVCEKAIEIQQCFSAKLDIVHVVEPIGTYGGGWYYLDTLNQEIEKQATENLAQYSEPFKIAKDNQHICSGSTKGMIIDLAEELKSDLIILGTHGAKGFAGLLGSTASSVLNAAKCAVLTIPTLDK